MGVNEAKTAILENRTALGIEFGSTRIKAVLIGTDHNPIAMGTHDWENQLENNIWTYGMDDIHNGLQDCYRNLTQNVEKKYGVPLTNVGAMGVSGMMHGYMVFDENDEILKSTAVNPAGHIIEAYLQKSKVCRSDRKLAYVHLNYTKGIDTLS